MLPIPDMDHGPDDDVRSHGNRRGRTIHAERSDDVADGESAGRIAGSGADRMHEAPVGARRRAVGTRPVAHVEPDAGREYKRADDARTGIDRMSVHDDDPLSRDAYGDIRTAPPNQDSRMPVELPHDDDFTFGADEVELVDDGIGEESEEPPIRFDPDDASMPFDPIPASGGNAETGPYPTDDGYRERRNGEDDGMVPEPDMPMSGGLSSSGPAMEPDDRIEDVSGDDADGHDSMDDGKSNRGGLFSRIRGAIPDMSGFGSRLRAEIGVGDGDVTEPAGLVEPQGRHGTAADSDDVVGGDGKGRGRRSMPHPVRGIMGAYRKVSRIRRRIYVATGIFACVVGVWTVPNLHAAFNPSSSSFESNEGTVKVSEPSYSDGHVSFKATNDSDMIAHISVKADVKAWSPVPRWPTSLFAPRTVMGCGQTSEELDPGKSKTITMECHGGGGVWKRPAIEVMSE